MYMYMYVYIYYIYTQYSIARCVCLCMCLCLLHIFNTYAKPRLPYPLALSLSLSLSPCFSFSLSLSPPLPLALCLSVCLFLSLSGLAILCTRPVCSFQLRLPGSELLLSSLPCRRRRSLCLGQALCHFRAAAARVKLDSLKKVNPKPLKPKPGPNNHLQPGAHEEKHHYKSACLGAQWQYHFHFGRKPCL